MEHSLLALSKWEQKFHKPFFSEAEKTEEELMYYFYCMSVTPGVTPLSFKYLTPELVETIKEYINDPMTATTIREGAEGNGARYSREIITNEIVYYWMTELGIDLAWENRHINQLMTLIRVCNIKKSQQQKLSKSATSSKNRGLNAARRAAYHSKG